ncbi:MAG: hypothetical protein GXY32_07110 [Ruminococcaceae bacterium]|nr:hypothetical protein [Oscillospiraceae bacterium]
MMYTSYCIGILAILFSKASHWLAAARGFAVLAVLAFALRFFMPSPTAQLVCLAFCWAGLGGCVAYAIYLYVFVLNNPERLFGVLLIAFAHGMFMCLIGLGISGVFLTIVLPAMLTLLSAACIFLVKPLDISAPQTQPQAPHPSIWLSTVFFALLFILDSASSFIFTHQSLVAQVVNGIGVFVAILLSVIIQIIYKQSVWHMWNLFFVLSFLCHLLPLVSNTGLIFDIASFLHGILYVGYIAIFYTISGIYKKHGSIQLLKKNLFRMFGLVAPSLVVLGLMERYWPQSVTPFIIVGSATLFFVFVLMSPLFQRYFFGADWVKDFGRLDMQPLIEKVEETDHFENLGLSPREREVCVLLLKGFALRQIAANLHIAYPTVNTYYTSLYRKLNINSKGELFARFGVQLDNSAEEDP